MARVAGLEPATFRLTIGCATIAPHPNTETRLYFVFTVVQPYLAGGVGFEPTITESKSVVLPVTLSPNKEDGWGTRIRTLIIAFRVRGLTISRFPNSLLVLMADELIHCRFLS